MEYFHMTDIIPLLGLPTPPAGKSNYNIPCPCCDDKPKGKHLNINLHKDVFRCPRCGFSGGVLDLYAYYARVSREEALKELLARKKIPCHVPKPKLPKVEESPLTGIEERHATYSALLKGLTLASDHRQNLLCRGLSEEEILRLGYKTTPVLGYSSLAKRLRDAGLYLEGVPGFYKKRGQWTIQFPGRGILIPVRDIAGRIQGLQIRLDNVEKRKFRWLSSAELEEGCGAKTWVHLAGDPRPLVILTEGPLKADVIHFLTGQTVLAVAGVNSLSQLKPVLEELRAAGMEKIVTAFDMDYLTNPHVQNGQKNLNDLLEQSGIPYSTYLWDPRYKGLDDYIWGCLCGPK